MSNNSEKKNLPASNCVCCERSLEEMGGKRITAQTVRGYTVLDKPRTGGKNDPKYRNITIGDSLYLCIWGGIWHQEAIHRAVSTIKDGLRPWFCQACGQRLCSTCGHPVNRPMGSDILMDDGANPHAGIMPYDPGCSNLRCERYRKLKHG